MNHSETSYPKKQRSWLWKAYFLFTLLITSGSAIYFFQEKSPINLYYQILIAFDIHYLIPYCFNALSVLLNLTSLLPFYFFVCRNPFLSEKFCQWLLCFRLIFDLTGHSYEFQIIKSLNFQDKAASWAAIAVIVLFSLPSYVANYLYAFRRESDSRSTG